MNNQNSDFQTFINSIFSPIAMAQTADDIEDIERQVELIAAQRNHQSTEMGMNFFPSDGRCYRCRTNLIDAISEDRLRNESVTGCPSCHHSFVG